MSRGNRQSLRKGRALLLSEDESFRDAFARFEDYSLNGWSEAKDSRCGMQASVVAVRRDRTVTVEFDDGYVDDFPFEAFAEQLTVWSKAERKRRYELRELRGMLARLEAETDIDAFDMVALEPEVPARLLAGNRTRAIICALVQMLVPILVGAFLVQEIVTSENGGPPRWDRMCNASRGWDRAFPKVVNKLIGVVLLLYMYNFLESRHYHWISKPTCQLLFRGLVFRIMPQPAWCAIGLILNAFALSICGFVSVIVIYYSEDPLELVLNSFALFFIADIDDLLVDKFDFQRNKDRLKRALEHYRGNETLEVSSELPGFHRALFTAHRLVDLVKVVLLFSPAYIIVCK